MNKKDEIIQMIKNLFEDDKINIIWHFLKRFLR